MRRREFIAMLGGVAAALPLDLRAQQTPIIRVSQQSVTRRFRERLDAFRRGLRESGFVDGHNVALEFRWHVVLMDVSHRWQPVS
jgi:putative ABC transport system substrate-binding protein